MTNRERISGVDAHFRGFLYPVAAYQRSGQAVRVVDVVEAVAALDAEAAAVGRAVAAADLGDAPVPDVEGELAADAAVGA